MGRQDIVKDQVAIWHRSVMDVAERLGQSLSEDTRTHLLLILLLFLTTRCLFLFTPGGRFGDADQAVFGMMAQEIAALKGYPLYMWEAHYAGAPVAYLSAILFHFFGAGFVQLRVAMMLIVFPFYLLFYFIYRRLLGNPRALIAVLFLLFCPYLVLNYTTAAYGGYGESFLGTALIILLSWKIQDQTVGIRMQTACFLLGLLCGFFVYIHLYALPAVLVFAIPTLWRFGKDRIKFPLLFGLGGLIGITPLIVYIFMTGGGTLTRGAAWVFLIGRNDISAPLVDVIRSIFLQKGNYLLGWFSNAPFMFGQYVTPVISGRGIQIAAGWLLIVILVGYIVLSFQTIRGKGPVAFYHRQFASYVLTFILFQWVASLHADRHFMPLFFVIPIAICGLTERFALSRKIPIVIMMLLGFFEVIGWNQEFRAYHFNPLPVVKTMGNLGIREFYSSYWRGYPIMFLGEGRLIGSPLLLPCGEPFSDRRPKYTEQVRRSWHAAFVFGVGEEPMEREFLSFLMMQEIKFDKIEIEETRIYYNLARPVKVSFDKKDRHNFFSVSPT